MTTAPDTTAIAEARAKATAWGEYLRTHGISTSATVGEMKIQAFMAGFNARALLASPPPETTGGHERASGEELSILLYETYSFAYQRAIEENEEDPHDRAKLACYNLGLAARPVPVQEDGPNPALVKWLQGGIEYFRRKGTGEVGEWWSRQIARVFDPARLPVKVPVQADSEKAFALDAAHLIRQRDFSQHTFGPGERLQGVLDHIRKELIEVETKPSDISEWADVIILSFDGALRQGHGPQHILDAIVAKQTKNEARAWPDWRTADPNKAIEHVRIPVPPTTERPNA